MNYCNFYSVQQRMRPKTERKPNVIITFYVSSSFSVCHIDENCIIFQMANEMNVLAALCVVHECWSLPTRRWCCLQGNEQSVTFYVQKMIKSFPFWCGGGIASVLEILLLYYLSVEKFESRAHIFRCQRNYVTKYMMTVI